MKNAHHFFTEDNVALELTFKRLFAKLWPYLWKHKVRVEYHLEERRSLTGLGRYRN